MNLARELSLVLEALLLLGFKPLHQVLLLYVLEAPELGSQLCDLLDEFILGARRQLLKFQLLAQGDALLSQVDEIGENCLALVLPTARLDAQGMQVAQVHLAICSLLEVLEESVLIRWLLLLVKDAAGNFRGVGELQACLQECVHICRHVARFPKKCLKEIAIQRGSRSGGAHGLPQSDPLQLRL